MDRTRCPPCAPPASAWSPPLAVLTALVCSLRCRAWCDTPPDAVEIYRVLPYQPPGHLGRVSYSVPPLYLDGCSPDPFQVGKRTVYFQLYCHSGFSPLHSALGVGVFRISLCVLRTHDHVTWVPTLYLRTPAPPQNLSILPVFYGRRRTSHRGLSPGPHSAWRSPLPTLSSGLSQTELCNTIYGMHFRENPIQVLSLFDCIPADFLLNRWV